MGLIPKCVRLSLVSEHYGALQQKAPDLLMTVDPCTVVTGVFKNTLKIAQNPIFHNQIGPFLALFGPLFIDVECGHLLEKV